jgi:hypothetical protein
VKGDFALDQAQFQSLVTSEEMSIGRKNLSALEQSFQCPGYLASNTVPDLWIDNGGQVVRRLVVVGFHYAPQKAVSNLLEKMLSEELAAIIRKVSVHV